MARPRLPIGAHGKITLEKLDAGKWRARTLYRFDDGKRRQVERTAPTKAKAENALLEALTKIQTPAAHGATMKGAMTVSELADAYMVAQEKAKLSPNTLRAYRQYLKPVNARLGALLVSQVKTMRVQSFMDEVSVTNGAGMASGCRTVLSGMFQLAIRNDLITINPVRAVKGAKQSGDRAAVALEPADVERMMTAIRRNPDLVKRDFCDLWEFISLVGCRIAEACALTEERVDLAKGTVKLGPSVAKEAGAPPFIYEDAKTKKSNRTIVVPARAIQIIERRLATRPWTQEGAIFPDPLGKLYAPSKVEQIWARNRAAIGFPTFTSHGFRKTVATVLDDAGMTARDIAEYLGHKKPSMTQDVYMALNKQSEKMAEVITAKFGVSSGFTPPEGRKSA